MGTEVEHASGDIQTSVTASSTTTSTTGTRISMFAKKSGFVIPKNKLSGSLVPVYRGSKKGDADLTNEEATNQVLRKTKWGPDLTLDTTVRKGRAIAYQTRIDQISQQLTLGTLEFEDNEGLLSRSEFQHKKTSDHQLSKEESELLELERREIIGEVLKLNPTYKAPADYKPLLKEAEIPIPIKEYPGYNFISLVFGPASDTQKRLEKETGAKIQVYGTKSDTGGKVEVTHTDGNNINNAYEDLYVHVSADTFDKIDAAVALIELLLTPVSVNPVSSSTTSTPISDNNNNPNTNQITPSSIISSAPINPQPYTGSLPPPQGQLPQYPQPWFSAGPTYSQIPANSSEPLLSNTVQISSSPFNPTMPSLFGPRPVVTASFSTVLQNPSIIPPRPQLSHVLQPPYMQQAFPVGPTSGPRNTHGPPLTGPTPYNVRPAFSTPPVTPPIVPSHGHNAMASQNMVVSGGPTVNQPTNMISPRFGPSASQSAPSTIQTSAIGSARPIMPQVAMRPPFPNARPGNQSFFPGNAHNFDSVKPHSAAIARPQQPSSNDFTFQPQPPPNIASQVWQSSQPPHHNVRPPIQAGPRPMMGNLNPSAVQGFPRHQISNPVNQPRAQIPPNFTGSPTVSFPPRHPILPGHNAVASVGLTHMQPRNFISPRSINNSSGPFPPRPGNQMHIPENHVGPLRFSTPHQHFGNHPGPPFSGVQQVYDPFSPTSVPFNPQRGGNGARQHGESDPEYEDLMASVGVQ